jgi:nucleotide-binding universal stress UspA family protein
MSRTILVPLDGSPFAEHALPVAISIARRTGAALELIIVDRPPVSWVVPEVPLVMDEAFPATDGLAYLESLHARMPADVPVHLTRLEGRPVPFIVKHITNAQPWLVVMSTHGRGGFSRLWLGSVADGVARQSPSPVLLVKPPAAAPELAAEKHFQRVVVPLDGSVASEEILDQALAIFGTAGVAYTLARVISPLAVEHPVDPNVTSVRRSETHPESLLEAEADRLRARGATVTHQLLVHDSPVNAIADLAADVEADTIAMTTHARRGVSRFVMGSIADKVLRSAPCPVLLFHPTHETVDLRRRVEAATAAAVPL